MHVPAIGSKDEGKVQESIQSSTTPDPRHLPVTVRNIFRNQTLEVDEWISLHH